MNSSSDRPISEMVCDGVRVGDPLKSVRADGETRDEIRQQQRLPRHLRRHRHDPRGDDADGDVGDESVLHAREKLTSETPRKHTKEFSVAIQLPQRIQRGLRRAPVCLPLGEALLVFQQNLRRNFLREVRIGQFLLDLENFGFDFLDFLCEPRFFGFDVNQTFERQK